MRNPVNPPRISFWFNRYAKHKTDKRKRKEKPMKANSAPAGPLERRLSFVSKVCQLFLPCLDWREILRTIDVYFFEEPGEIICYVYGSLSVCNLLPLRMYEDKLLLAWKLEESVQKQKNTCRRETAVSKLKYPTWNKMRNTVNGSVYNTSNFKEYIK